MSRKKYLALIPLLLAQILTASCGVEQPQTETSGDSSEEVSTEADAPKDILDTFPTVDFGGRAFNIVSSPVDKADYNELSPESVNGEVINDSVYERNIKVQNKYNVEIKWLESGRDETANFIRNSVQAGDDSFEYAICPAWQSGGLAADGVFYNLRDVPYVDLTKPWWNQSVVDSLTVNGQTYIGQNDIPIYTVITMNHIMYFDKKLAEDNGIEDIYALVDDGKWTLDKFAELSATVGADLNGDSKMDLDDQYGFLSTTGSLSIFLPSCDQSIMKRGSDGYPELALNCEKTVNIIEKIRTICNDKANSKVGDISHGDEYIRMFVNGQALFFSGYISDVGYFRDMSDDFGLIPAPKYDENQEKYYTLIQGTSAMCGVPASVQESDLEFVGLVSESLAALSNQDTRGAVYDAFLKGKILRDEESIKNLDMISGNIVADFGFIYDYGLAFPIWRTIEQKKDFASWYAKLLPQVEENYAKLMETFKGATN